MLFALFLIVGLGVLIAGIVYMVKEKGDPDPLALFFLSALFEIGGGYLVWLWLRENKGALFGLLGGLTLAVYGIVQTFQPAHFGRVYAAYGGIFIVFSLIWGALVDKKNRQCTESSVKS